MNLTNLKVSIIEKLKVQLTRNTILRIVFYLLLVISITLKGIYFQGFVGSKTPYNFSFGTGYSSVSPFMNYYIAFAVVFLSFTLLFKGKGKWIFPLIINAVLTFLFVLDLWYFRGFQTVPSVIVATQTANLDNMSGSILSLTTKLDFIFVIDFLVLIPYIIVFRKSFKKVKSNFKGFAAAFLISIIYIGYVPFNINVLGNKDVKNSYLFSNYDATNTARYFSSIGYHLFDVYNTYKDLKPYKLTADEQKEVKDFYAKKNENLPDNSYKGLFNGKNLLIIQVESLENFVIGQKADGQEITPNLNKLLNNSIYFPHVFEQVNEGTSSDSDLMVNTGMLPLRKGSTFFRYPNRDYISLPKLLGEKGYESTAIHPDKGSFWNYADGLKGIGFNNFIDYYSFNPDEVIGLGLSDETYFKQVVPMIKKMKQPFYTFTVTLTNHGPFELPDKYKELNLTGELKDSLLGNSFQTVHYTDKQIGMFLNELDKNGLLDNTVVVIEGDHTGVHKYYNDKVNEMKNPENWWLDNNISSVPYIVYQKNYNNPVKIDTYGGQVDMMPTISYLMGVDESKYINSALGRNLLKTNKSFAYLTNGTLRGTLSKEDQDLYKQVFDISDKMIKSDYFKNYTDK
ncbi:LTA synthase family protein [Clostridium paridis]|uniref:LTA synthase family protein n=1 Tax=Clostridium paridis TaxID=2803863 RepID=A0A937FGU8_9CLOT|nr:LTA synthase family protein [Clostridium paridis]MBL4932740.1 LTA synthase family protein [Clostridium paridis]